MEHIIYAGDLSAVFDPNLIDNVQIKCPLTGAFRAAEHWGWNDEGENNQPYYDFGCLGPHLHFEIYKEYMRLYSGTGLELADGQNYWPDQTVDFYPETMGDFLEAVDDFMILVIRGINDIKKMTDYGKNLLS